MPMVKTEVNKESAGLVHYVSQLSGYTVKDVYRACIELLVGGADIEHTLTNVRAYLAKVKGPPPQFKRGTRKVG